MRRRIQQLRRSFREFGVGSRSGAKRRADERGAGACPARANYPDCIRPKFAFTGKAVALSNRVVGRQVIVLQTGTPPAPRLSDHDFLLDQALNDLNALDCLCNRLMAFRLGEVLQQ